MSDRLLWEYNLRDCINTRECGEISAANVISMGLEGPEAFQQSMFMPVLQAMLRGIRIDTANRGAIIQELQDEMAARELYFVRVFGHSLNPASSPQMQKLFYEDLKQPHVISRAKKGKAGHLTCDDEALNKIKLKEPLLTPLINAIQEYRSIGVFLSTFALAPLDIDGRMRCSFNLCGTETFRMSSSKNAFGSGMNMQNIPKGGKFTETSDLSLPNIRKLFIPDPGYTFFDMDLDRADLQVVAWETDEPDLKFALKHGVDMHMLNAYAITGKEAPPLEELVESHSRYPDHRGRMKRERQFAKAWCHGTNYGGGARTMAIAAGITVAASESAQRVYFGKYPGIKAWHDRVQEQLNKGRFVENAFGYRRHYFDRPDKLLSEGLAWIPQSTVGIYINKLWRLFYDNIPELQVLLQVHDSLGGQFPTRLSQTIQDRMHALASTCIIPYEDPLVIPVGIKVSSLSWGACE